MATIYFEVPTAAPGSDAGAAGAPRAAESPGGGAFDEQLRRARGEEEHPGGAAAVPSEPAGHRTDASPATGAEGQSMGKGGDDRREREEKDLSQDAIAPVAAQASPENSEPSGSQPDLPWLQVTASEAQVAPDTKVEQLAMVMPGPKGETSGTILAAMGPNCSRLPVPAPGQTIVAAAPAVSVQASVAGSHQPVESTKGAPEQLESFSGFPANGEKKQEGSPPDSPGPGDTPVAAESNGQNLAPAAMSKLVRADAAMATAAPTSEASPLARGVPAKRTSNRQAYGVEDNIGAGQPSQRTVFAVERDEAASAEAGIKANRPLLPAEPRLNHEGQGIVRPSESVPLHPPNGPEPATGRPADSDLPSRPQAGPDHGAGTGMEPADRVRFVQRVARAMEAADIRGTPLRIRLHPPELGSLRVEVTVRNGGLSARLEAETEAARALLVDHLPMLRERLAEHHLRIERFDVQWSGGSSAGWSQHPGQEASRQPSVPGAMPEPRRPANPPAIASPPPSPRRSASSHIDVMI